MIDSLVREKVTSSVCSSIAMVFTGYRLIIRRRNLWVDDGCALFSMLSLLAQVVAVFMKPSHKNGVIRYYIMDMTFYATVWSARLSILFSIIRFDPSPTRRRVLYIIACMFLIICLVLMGQLFWVCEPQEAWKSLNPPQCTLNGQVAIFQFVSDVIADVILLVHPIQLFIVLEDRWSRYLLMLIFSTCIITTIVSLVHAIYILRYGGPKIVVAAIVENSVSLVVCNIPVVVTAFLRLGNRFISDRRPIAPLSAGLISFAPMWPSMENISEEQLTTIQNSGEGSIQPSKTTKGVNQIKTSSTPLA